MVEANDYPEHGHSFRHYVFNNPRCVTAEDLSFAFGLHYLSTKVFAHIPGPILFGHVVDLNCAIWQEVCEKTGHCLIYDMEAMMRMVTMITGILTGTCLVHHEIIGPQNIRGYQENDRQIWS